MATILSILQLNLKLKIQNELQHGRTFEIRCFLFEFVFNNQFEMVQLFGAILPYLRGCTSLCSSVVCPVFFSSLPTKNLLFRTLSWATTRRRTKQPNGSRQRHRSSKIKPSLKLQGTWSNTSAVSGKTSPLKRNSLETRRSDPQARRIESSR